MKTHKVGNERYSDIAQLYYNDPECWPTLEKANNIKPEDLKPGMEIKVPDSCTDRSNNGTKL
jgi:hypothetical protein